MISTFKVRIILYECGDENTMLSVISKSKLILSIRNLLSISFICSLLHVPIIAQLQYLLLLAYLRLSLPCSVSPFPPFPCLPRSSSPPLSSSPLCSLPVCSFLSQCLSSFPFLPYSLSPLLFCFSSPVSLIFPPHLSPPLLYFLPLSSRSLFSLPILP